MKIDYRSAAFGMLLGIAGTHTGQCTNDYFRERSVRQAHSTELSTLVQELGTEDARKAVLEQTGKLLPAQLKEKIDHYVEIGLYDTAAEFALDNGDKKQAIQLYERAALDAKPHDPPMHLWMSGKVLQLNGKDTDANLTYLQASRIYESANQYVLAAITADDGKDFPRAMKLYEQAGEFLLAKRAAERSGNKEKARYYDRLDQAVRVSKKH